MLHQTKRVQLVVFPKIFNVLSFYSKGQYTVEISIVQESIDGKVTYAMPKIMENKNHKLHESKKAYLRIEKDKKQLAFVTEQFYITYNEESVALHTMALFTLEVDPNYHTKTYINFVLNTNRYKIQQPNGHVELAASTDTLNKIRNSNSSPTNKKKIVTEVDRRRIYINNLTNLDQYKRIIFSECQYFSFLDVYIGSCYLGTRFRLKRHQLSDFYCAADKEKIQFREVADQFKLTMEDKDRGNLLAKETGLSPQEFRAKFNSELFTAYTDLRQRMQTLVKMFEDQNSFTQGREHIKTAIQVEIHLETILKSKQELLRYYYTESTEELYLHIYNEIVQFDGYLTYLWGLHLRLIQHLSYRVFCYMIHKHLMRENSSKEKSMISNMKIDSEIRRIQQTNFIKRRKQVLDDLKIYEDDDMYHPFIMIQNFQDVTSAPPSTTSQITSLVIFIHGYQGSDYDLEKAKNFLTVYNPNVYGLLIKSIQDEIDENIEHLGLKVSQQIKSHISGSVNAYRKISILGYSLGGVIAREAIKHLEEFKDKMNLLATFASPHLGVSINDNKLVGTGIWYLINFEKVKNLKQLNCEKTGEEGIITLDTLSDSECLSWFKKLIVVSSEEDNFVPYHSSRISQDIKNEQVQQMAKKILSRVKKIERVEVWFDVDHDIKTFDKILGRRAHIQFLENRIFLDLFFRLYGKQF